LNPVSLTVDAQFAVPNHLLDLSLLLQIIQRLPCQAAIDLQSVDERSDCDKAVGLDVFVELVGRGFIEDDGVVCLVLDYLRVNVSANASCRRQYGYCQGMGLRREKVVDGGGATYPCPLTTSSFASCRQMLLRVPVL